MKIIDFKEIKGMCISPMDCVSWVRESFSRKYEAELPPKISMKIPEHIFFNTMPCRIPWLNRFGVKEVSRFPNRVPTLQADILLYDSLSGNLLAMLDGSWITTMRTGAVAALAIQTLRSCEAKIYSFVGLGNTARATMLCLLESEPEHNFIVRLLRYKNQAEDFQNRFSAYSNVQFEFVETMQDLIVGADVVVSCVTAYDEPVAKDKWFKEGVLLVPVHTRGFQNCDLFFDKVFGDDLGHIRGFKYFEKFKQFAEFSDVLLKKVLGRENSRERIIAYNIGLGLHDILFASKIYEKSCSHELLLNQIQEKFWV